MFPSALDLLRYRLTALGGRVLTEPPLLTLDGRPMSYVDNGSLPLSIPNRPTASASLIPPPNDLVVDRVAMATGHAHADNCSSVYRKRLFSCPECRYATDRKNNLKRHVTTMHSVTSKQLDCCGLSFTNKAALRAHVSVFHASGYTCATCRRVFGRKALLRRHLSVHRTVENEAKQHRCPRCPYSTSHKSNLERHAKVHTQVHERIRATDDYPRSKGSRSHNEELDAAVIASSRLSACNSASLARQTRHVAAEPTLNTALQANFGHNTLTSLHPAYNLYVQHVLDLQLSRTKPSPVH